MKDKQEIKILVICIGIILILIGLTFKVSVDAQKYNCNACNIEFKTKTAAGRFGGFETTMPINTNLSYLYYGYVRDECYVIWDPNSGYMKNG